MNACSIKGTSYEKEYRQILSEPAMIFVWNANNEQPLDKKKVGNEVIENPLYTALLNHPVTKGERQNALKLVAQSFLPAFTREYTPNEEGDYSLEQVVSYIEKRQKQAQDQREQLKSSINLPTSMAINIPDGVINETARQIFFSEEQGQDIYDTLQYLLGVKKSWDGVYSELVNQRNTILGRVKAGQHFSEDPERLAYNEILVQNFDKIKSWYDSKEGLVGEAELESQFGDSEDWKSKDKSQAQRASSVILGLVTSLPAYRTAIPGEIDFETGEEYQEVTQVQVQSNVTGLPKSGDFQKNWSLLGSTLSGMTNYSDMYEAIESLASRYPQFSYLLSKIPNAKIPGSFKDIRQFLLASEFKRVFSVPEVSSVVVDVTLKEDGKIATTQQLKGFQPVRNAVALYDSQYFSYNQKYLVKGLEGNEVNLEGILEDFQGLFNDLGSALAKKVPMQNFLFPTRVDKFVQFLQSVGLGLNNQEYLKSTNVNGTKEFIQANLDKLKTIYEKLKIVSIVNEYLADDAKIKVDKPLSFIRDTIQDIYVSKGKVRPDVEAALAQAFADNKLRYKGGVKQAIGYLGIKKTELNPFITFFTQYDAEFRPSSYMNAADKKKFVRGPWFYLTQQTNVLNAVSSYDELINTPGFERFDYRKNPDMLGSLWLQRMFGLPRTKNAIEANPLATYVRKKDTLGNPIELNIANFDGMEIKNFGAKSGRTTTDQHPNDKIFQDFASFFQSLEMENIRFGDKTSAFTVRASNPILSEKIYIALNAAEMITPTNRVEAEKDLTNLFNGYLASEATRIIKLIEEKGRGTTYDRLGKNLFIFNDILPEETLNKFKNATSKEEVIAAYTEATSMMSSVLQDYFGQESQKLVDKLLDTFSTSVNIKTGQEVTQAQRLKQTVEKLNKLNLISTQLLPSELRDNPPKITVENLSYLAEIYLKNGFVHNVEFLKMFVGDLSNFNKTNLDAREIFKRIPFTSSPGNVFFWDEAAQEFFDNDTNQDALSIAYTGVSNKFSPILKTVVYNDVNTFSAESYEEYKKVYDTDDSWDALTENEKSEFSAYINKSDEESNAQGVITLDSYRNYLLGINRWSSEQEQAYNKQIRLVKINQELRNNPTNAEELYKEKNEIVENFGSALFPPLKLGHYGAIVEDPKLIALHKYSLIPLIPSAIEGKALEKQLELMYRNKINYYTFKSGSKMAQYGESIDFYKEVTNDQGEKVLVVNDALGENNVTSIHLENLREQQYQAPKFKTQATLATQMMKLVFGDFFENGEISSDFSEGTQRQIQSLYDSFKNNINDLVTFETVKLERKLGIKRNEAREIVGVDQLQMARFFAEELENKEAPDALRRFIQVNEDGTFKYPLDAINNRNQLESLVLNVINNKVISQKINGESYIQVAGTGFEAKRYVKPTAEQLKEFGANDLQFYTRDPITGETLPMEVKVGFNVKKHGGLLNLQYGKGKVETLKQLNKILGSKAPLDVAWKKKHMDKLTMVGVRIPVQGFSQMEYATIKEFLPETVGAIMVLPAQIVVKSGGDYDIDKLTFFETAYDNKGETYKKEFNVKDYESKLEKQKELKKTKQELIALTELIEKEIADNDIFRERESLKKEINEIQKEIKEAKELVEDFLDSGFLTKEDATWAREAASDKEDLQRAFADLDSFDNANDVRVLQTMSLVKNKLRELSKEVASIDAYKKSLSNNLVDTLKGVLMQGELYNALITPNTNSVLTQYTTPGEKISTTAVFSPLTSWRIYMENILSKDALGIDAKINTLQKEFQRAGLKITGSLLKKYYFESNKDSEGNILLGGKKDARGENRISKVLSEFINGHVDIAKEDWIILLGLDAETSPLAHAMILTGTPVEQVLGLINSPIIKTVFQLGNRPEIQKKLDNIRPNKKKAILGLIKNRLTKVTDPEVQALINAAQLGISNLKVKSTNSITDTFVNNLLVNPRFNKHIGNFNPKESLSEEEAAIRDLAYLMQFYVVVRQQDSLRELTSMSDFNTTNYRTSFQSEELLTASSKLKNNFNAEAIDFMFKDSALAQFNVGNLVQQTMRQIYPLSDSKEVHSDIYTFMERKGLFKEEEKMLAIQSYKNNILVPYVLLNAQTPEKGNLLEYYRGKKGIFVRTTANNMAERFQKLLQNPEMRNNFVMTNIYIDVENQGREIEFKLKNTDVDENSKSYRIAFLEGLNSPNAEVKSFFEDLGMGSYLQYAGSFASGHVSTIVPHEVYVSYTTNAFNKLTELKDTDSPKFEAYLSLVRFSTKMALETAGPIKGSSTFFVDNYGEMAKTITGLSPEVLKIYKNRENLISSKIESLEQSLSTSVNPADFTNHSGGAKGYDAEWDIIGEEFSMVNNKHYLLPSDGAVSDPRLQAKGVKPVDATNDVGPVALQGAATGEAQIAVTNAERAMGRIESNHTTRNTKKIRNYAQVKNADGIFAIGSLIPKGADITIARGQATKKALVPQVNGGTSVAVQLGITMGKPTYVFNQVANNNYPQGWYKWDNTKQDFVSINTPVLTKNFAGIGTSSSTTEAGKQAIRDVYTETFKPTQPSTSVKGFQGYQGGFENTGKGTPQGDGKDKAMRQIANVFIGELSKNGKGSTFTSAKEIAQKQGEEPITSGARFLDGDKNKYVNEIYSASIKLKGQPLVVMLARNGKLAGQELSVETKRKIKGLSEQAATFVVGDMLGVDSQFIDYLQEIGAKFTVYHTGATSRIQITQPFGASNVEQDSLETFEEDSDVTDTNVPNTPTQFPPTKTDAIQLTLKLDPDQKDDDKGNLDDLGFEEDTCEIV